MLFRSDGGDAVFGGGSVWLGCVAKHAKSVKKSVVAVSISPACVLRQDSVGGGGFGEHCTKLISGVEHYGSGSGRV